MRLIPFDSRLTALQANSMLGLLCLKITGDGVIERLSRPILPINACSDRAKYKTNDGGDLSTSRLGGPIAPWIDGGGLFSHLVERCLMLGEHFARASLRGFE